MGDVLGLHSVSTSELCTKIKSNEPKANWCLPEVRGLTFEAGIALLDRAAEVGLLTRTAAVFTPSRYSKNAAVAGVD